MSRNGWRFDRSQSHRGGVGGNMFPRRIMRRQRRKHVVVERHRILSRISALVQHRVVNCKVARQLQVRINCFSGKNDLAVCSQKHVSARHINTGMSKVVKRAVAQVVAKLGHVGLTMHAVSRLNGHARISAKWVHFNRRRGGTITIDALKRRLWESEPFLKRKIRRMIVTLIGMFSGKRVVDGWVVYRPSLNNLAAETWQTNTSRDRAAMNHVLSNTAHPVHVRWHNT